jgi:hypothetical protein
MTCIGPSIKRDCNIGGVGRWLTSYLNWQNYDDLFLKAI